MRTIDLEKEPLDLAAVIKLASQEPVLIVTRRARSFAGRSGRLARKSRFYGVVRNFSVSLTSDRRARDGFR